MAGSEAIISLQKEAPVSAKTFIEHLQETCEEAYEEGGFYELKTLQIAPPQGQRLGGIHDWQCEAFVPEA